MTDNLSARLALVTGAAKGIGAATAIALAADGYHVVANDIDEAGLALTAATVAAAGGLIEIGLVDVRSTEHVETMARSVVDRHGIGFDLVVNNAGFASVAFLEDITDANWDEVLNLNLKSMMRVARAAVPGMRARGGGTIVCLGSIAGHSIGWPGRLAYSSAKAGVTGLVRGLAIELASAGITVNGIAPAGLHATADQVPLGYVGKPSDIASVVTLLASPRARFMTGQMLSVDGGMSIAL